MVFLTIVECELEKKLQIIDIIGKENNVISLPKSSYLYRTKAYSKRRVLGRLDLLIVVTYIQVPT